MGQGLEQFRGQLISDVQRGLSAWVADDSSVLCWENEVGYSVVGLGFVWCMGDLRKVGLCGSSSLW